MSFGWRLWHKLRRQELKWEKNSSTACNAGRVVAFVIPLLCGNRRPRWRAGNSTPRGQAMNIVMPGIDICGTAADDIDFCPGRYEGMTNYRFGIEEEYFISDLRTRTVRNRMSKRF